jgi:hypothetical protein
MGSFRRTAAAMLAVLALTAALAGCARDTVVGGVGVAAPQPEGSGDVDQALAAWKDFPVGRHPRPIVLIGPVAVRYAGYTTDNAKIAAMSGRYRLDVPLPPDPPAANVTLADGPATVPVIGAAAAVDLMKADAGESKGSENVPPLAIVGFEFGTEALPTDRGTVTLPVWRVHTADELGPTVVLAVADSALARPAASQSTSTASVMPGGNTATVDATGTHLTLTVAESDPHCPGEAIYKRTPVVRESGTAVAVGFTATQTGTVPGSGACALYLKLKQVTYRVDLAAPLGARVLVTALGEPAPVTTG